MAKVFFQTETAAEEFGLSRRHFTRTAQRLGIHPVMIGGRQFWMRPDLAKLKRLLRREKKVD